MDKEEKQRRFEEKLIRRILSSQDENIRHVMDEVVTIGKLLYGDEIEREIKDEDDRWSKYTSVTAASSWTSQAILCSALPMSGAFTVVGYQQHVVGHSPSSAPTISITRKDDDD